MSKKAVIFDFDCTLASVNVSNLLPKIKYNNQDKNSVISIAMSRIFKNTEHLGTFKQGATKFLYDLPKPALLDFLRAQGFTYNKDQLQPVIESDPNLQLPAFIIEEIVAEMLWGGQARVDQLRELFDFLQKEGYSLMIASNGILALIIMSLKVVDLLKYFDFIQTSTYGIISNEKLSFAGLTQSAYKLPMSKSDLMKTLIFYEGYEQIIYIDDLDKDMKNLFNPFLSSNPLTSKTVSDLPYVSIKLCRCNLYFIRTLKPEGIGIQDAEIATIRALAQPV
jgi:FMN phosphatase YigB (HAD superfamily)